MKIRRLCIALLLVAAAIAKQPLAAAAADNAIAVTAPKAVNIGSDGEWIPLFVQGVITANLAQYSGLTVIDRQNADMVRAEQKLGESALYSDADAIELGNLTHARYIVTGSITGKGASYALLFSITDAQTGETKSSASVPNCLPSALENGEAANQISYDLMKGYGIKLSDEAVSALTKGASVMTAQTSAQASVAKGIVAERSGSNIEALTYYIQAKKNDGKLKEATSRMSTMSTVVASGNFGANAKNLMKLRNDWDKLLREAAELIAANDPEFEVRYFTDVEALELTEKNYENGTMSFAVGMPYLWQVDMGEENERLVAELLGALRKIPESKNWGAKINGFPWSYGKEIDENGGNNWLYFAAEGKSAVWDFEVSLLDAQKKKIATESVRLGVKFSKRFHTFPVINDREPVYRYGTKFSQPTLTFSDVPVGNADTDTIYVDVKQKYGKRLSIVPTELLSEKGAIKKLRGDFIGRIAVGGFTTGALNDAVNKTNPSNYIALDLTQTICDYTLDRDLPYRSLALRELWLSEYITKIEMYSLYYCSKLKKLVLPAGLENFNYYDNTDPRGVDYKNGIRVDYKDGIQNADIYFAGTKEQWDKIVFPVYSVCSDPNLDIHPDKPSGVIFDYDPVKNAKAEAEAEAERERCAAITEFTVPDGQTEIAEDAFRNYSGLETVTIPESVTKIGKYAFLTCKYGIIVRYRGTKKQWKKIKIEDGNTVLKKAQIWYDYKGN